MMLQSPTTTTAAAATTTVLETCWPTIETFTDLESTITLSSTCRSLHSLLTDATTHKVKVTHFQICNLPPYPGDHHADNNNNNNAISSSSRSNIPRNYTTAHIRIPHYTSHALNHIHFPSLHSLSIDFPLSKKRHSTHTAALEDLFSLRSSEYIEDVHTSSFPILVSQLSHASSNLTSFHLNTNRLLQHEKGGYFESTYEIFGHNLSYYCTHLQMLSIVNTGMVRGENVPMYSVRLAKTVLLPTLKRRKDVLRTLEYEVSGKPLVVLADDDDDHNRFGIITTHGGRRRRRDDDIIRETNCNVFHAVLQCTKLEKLKITCSWGPFCDFVQTTAAAAAMNGNNAENPSSSIRELVLICDKIYECEEDTTTTTTTIITRPRLPVGTMLHYFSKCHSLQTLGLQFPISCWHENESSSSSQTLSPLDGLRNLLLSNKPELRSVNLSFSGLDDREGMVILYLSDILPQLVVKSTLMRRILVVGLWNLDEGQLHKLAQCMEKLGFILIHNYHKRVIAFLCREDVVKKKKTLEPNDWC